MQKEPEEFPVPKVIPEIKPEKIKPEPETRPEPHPPVVIPEEDPQKPETPEIAPRKDA